jgi:hypothetical protein
MITIPEIVEQIIKSSPFLEEGLSEGIINLSALARKIKPEIEEKLMKEVQEGAIVMALKRLSPSISNQPTHKIQSFADNLGDIIVRNKLIVYTIENSATLVSRQKTLLERISDQKDTFFTVSQGINETAIILSKNIDHHFKELFRFENIISDLDLLSSISIKLPQGNNLISGIYYFMFKRLAWEDINIAEVISTTNEFTIVIEDKDIDRAFSVIQKMKY